MQNSSHFSMLGLGDIVSIVRVMDHQNLDNPQNPKIGTFESYCSYYSKIWRLWFTVWDVPGSVGLSDVCPLVFRRSRVHSSGTAKHSFLEIGYESISMAILSLPLIQLGKLSVTGERMYTKYWLPA